MRFIARMMGVLCCVQMAMAAAPSLYEIPLKDIDGQKTSLKAHEGKVLLLVNVASKCGYTPQYKGLEALQQKFKDQGLTVLGFPCNDFGAQEPGSNEDIKTFCSTTYGVTFPLYDKVHVKGPGQHPLFAALTGEKSPLPGEIKWNFSKFLIGRDGKLIQRFESKVAPDSPELVQAIQAALAKK